MREERPSKEEEEEDARACLSSCSCSCFFLKREGERRDINSASKFPQHLTRSVFALFETTLLLILLLLLLVYLWFSVNLICQFLIFN